MTRFVIPAALIAAWLGFAFIAPRALSGDLIVVFLLTGAGATVSILALTGHVSRPDPLSLNLTGRRPFWETR